MLSLKQERASGGLDQHCPRSKNRPVMAEARDARQIVPDVWDAMSERLVRSSDDEAQSSESTQMHSTGEEFFSRYQGSDQIRTERMMVRVSHSAFGYTADGALLFDKCSNIVLSSVLLYGFSQRRSKPSR